MNTARIKGTQKIITYGKNNAYCTDNKDIYVFTKEYYDSPEAMALCFAHEVCHTEDMAVRKHENEFVNELKIWGRTFGKLYNIFKIYPSKELQNLVVKSLTEYNKETIQEIQ